MAGIVRYFFYRSPRLFGEQGLYRVHVRRTGAMLASWPMTTATASAAREHNQDQQA